MTLSRVYIDLEYDHRKNIIELGAIEIKDGLINNVLHKFCRSGELDMNAYKICARHSHCIPPYLILEEGATTQQLNNDFNFSGIYQFNYNYHQRSWSRHRQERVNAIFPLFS